MTNNKEERHPTYTKDITPAPVVKDLTKPTDTLAVSTNNLMADILEADNQDDLKQLIALFNINQSKKNALRVLQLNQLLDLVTEEALKRYQKSPDEISNKELLDCMTAVSTQIEKSTQIVNGIEDKPMIQINQQKNEVNLNVAPKLSREQTENVIDVISRILNTASTPPPEERSQVIDAAVVTEDTKPDE